MISQLLEAIKPSKSESRLEARLAEAIADRDTKRTTLDGMLAADQDGAAVMKAEDALAASERRVLNLKSALNTAREKAVTEQDAAAEDAKRAAAAITVRLAESRHEAIERMAKSAAAFANDYNEVLRLNSDLLTHLPSHDDIASMTNRPTLETALRRHLVKNDLPWATQWAWGKVSLPDLVPQSEGALGFIRALVAR